MNTFTIPNTLKISAVCIFMEDDKPNVNHIPILGWIIDDEPGKYHFEFRSAVPILLETICANETLGILLEDGRVIIPEDIVYKDVDDFVVAVVDRWVAHQKLKAAKGDAP